MLESSDQLQKTGVEFDEAKQSIAKARQLSVRVKRRHRQTAIRAEHLRKDSIRNQAAMSDLSEETQLLRSELVKKTQDLIEATKAKTDLRTLRLDAQRQHEVKLEQRRAEIETLRPRLPRQGQELIGAEEKAQTMSKTEVGRSMILTSWMRLPERRDSDKEAEARETMVGLRHMDLVLFSVVDFSIRTASAQLGRTLDASPGTDALA